MKRILHTIGIFTGCFLLGITFLNEFSGCTKKTTTQPNPVIKYDLLKTRITIRFVDATTHEIIGIDNNKKVKVVVSGIDKEAVLDISGVKHNPFLSAKGFMTLALSTDATVVPSSENPVRFTLNASLEGYMTCQKTMTLTQEGDYQIRMVLADNENLPTGIIKSWHTGLGTIAGDTLTGDVTVNMPDLQLSLFIPKGTSMIDKNGNSLNSPLSVSLIYYNNLDNEVLSMFPGGLLSTVKQNGILHNGLFSTVGFMEIKIFGADGVLAKTFENKTPRVDMLLYANTYNPETQAKIAGGDLASLYRFEPDSSYWLFEHPDTILPYTAIPPLGDFVVSAEISRPSFYNIGWFNGNNCSTPAKLTFTFDTLSVCGSAFLTGIIKKQADSSYVDWIGCPVSNDGDTVFLPNMASGTPLFISWDNDSCESAQVAPDANPLSIDDPCSTLPFSVPLISTTGNIISLTVDISGFCPNHPDIKIRPSFGIWYRPENTLCWKWVDMRDGYSTLCGVTYGGNYLIGTYYDNRWQQWSFTVTDNLYVPLDLELSSNVCGNVFGL